MIKISKKTLQDLEYESVVKQIAELNITSLGKTKILNTVPFSNRNEVSNSLNLTNEFLTSFENENRILNHGFEDITEETYEEMLKSLTNVDLSNVIELDDNTDLSGELACSGGNCEIDVDMNSIKDKKDEVELNDA